MIHLVKISDVKHFCYEHWYLYIYTFILWFYILCRLYINVYMQLTISKNNISMETCLISPPPDFSFFLFLSGQLIYGFLSWACKEVNCMFCLYAKPYSSVLLLIQFKKWQSPIWCWTLIYFNVIVYFLTLKKFPDWQFSVQILSLNLSAYLNSNLVLKTDLY